MIKNDTIKILHRMEEDSSLLAIILSKNIGREVLEGELYRELVRSTLTILADVETVDSYLGTFERRGKVDRYVSTDRIQNSTAIVVTPNQTIC